MVIQQNFRVVGTGSYLPRQRLTAEDVDRRANLEPGWTRAHLGVETRYECVLPETLVSMGQHAIELALAEAGIGWDQVDYLIDCSTSQFRPIPCNAAHFQHACGASAGGIPCLDVHGTCLGSILALHLVNGLFSLGSYRHVVVVASESALRGVNWSQPESSGLMGDGAAAMVLRREVLQKPLAFVHETYAEHLDLCKVEGGGHQLPAREYTLERQAEFLFDMDGPALFRVALKRLIPMVRRLIAEFYSSDRAAGSQESLQVIPHQASPRALEAVRRMLEIPQERYHVAVRDIGNLAAASVPLMLDRVRRSGAIQPGDTLMLLGTSAGYSQAAMILQL